MKGLPADGPGPCPTSGIRSRKTRERAECTFATAVESTYLQDAPRWEPIIRWWDPLFGKGRVFYSAIGHPAASYTDEPLHLVMLENAIAWALGKAGGPGCPADK